MRPSETRRDVLRVTDNALSAEGPPPRMKRTFLHSIDVRLGRRSLLPFLRETFFFSLRGVDLLFFLVR